MNTQTLDFCIWLTGHDKETIEQMWNDWKQGLKKYKCSRCGGEYTCGELPPNTPCIRHFINRTSGICGSELIEVK